MASGFGAARQARRADAGRSFARRIAPANVPCRSHRARDGCTAETDRFEAHQLALDRAAAANRTNSHARMDALGCSVRRRARNCARNASEWRSLTLATRAAARGGRRVRAPLRALATARITTAGRRSLAGFRARSRDCARHHQGGCVRVNANWGWPSMPVNARRRLGQALADAPSRAGANRRMQNGHRFRGRLASPRLSDAAGETHLARCNLACCAVLLHRAAAGYAAAQLWPGEADGRTGTLTLGSLRLSRVSSSRGVGRLSPES